MLRIASASSVTVGGFMARASSGRTSEGDERSDLKRAAPRGDRSVPERMLALQRTAGNRAVGSLERARSPLRALQRDPLIQNWDSADTREEYVQRDTGEWFKQRVPWFPRTIDAANLNFFQLEE